MLKFQKYAKEMFKSDEFETALSHFSFNDKENLEKALIDLGITFDAFLRVALSVMTSKTSSDMRERLVAIFLGFSPKDSDIKLGYDGINALSEGLEVKAKNVSFNTKHELDLTFTINDYTLPRLEKDKLNNPHYALAGFIDGQLIFVITFRFNDSPDFANSLADQINKSLSTIQETKKVKRTIGRISLQNIPLSSIKVYTVLPKEDIMELRYCINQKLFDILMNSVTHGAEAKYVKEVSSIDEMFE
jgi:hypothetical protein